MKNANLHNHLSEDCLICGTILTGLGGQILRLTGLKISIVNPNVCNRCNMHIEDGKTTEVSILFVDLCSFTAITYELGPDKTHSIVHSFLNSATDAIINNDGVIDKYIGDAVMALFNVPIQHKDHATNALNAIKELNIIMPKLSKDHNIDLKFSAGLASGAVRIGKLGSNDTKDFTAIGDAVNRSSRLQALAIAGEIVLDAGAYRQVQKNFPNIIPEKMHLKGFPSDVIGHRIQINNDKSKITGPIHKEQHLKRRGFPAFWSVVLALLASPCIGGAALSPGALVLAFGALSGASLPPLSHTPFFVDKWWVKLPFMCFVILAVGINLFMIINARKTRKKLFAEGAKVELTNKERKVENWVIILSTMSVIIIIFEFIIHHFIMRFTIFS